MLRLNSGGTDGSGGSDDTPIKPPKRKEVVDKLLAKKLPDCNSKDAYDKIKDKGKFWYDSGAEQWADEYINAQEDHTEWTQSLYRDLFNQEADATKFVCHQPGAGCEHGKTCSKCQPGMHTDHSTRS